MTAPRYEYSQGDLLETPLKYIYTALQGAPFLEAWRAARAGVRADLGEARAFAARTPGGPPQGPPAGRDGRDFAAAGVPRRPWGGCRWCVALAALDDPALRGRQAGAFGL